MPHLDSQFSLAGSICLPERCVNYHCGPQARLYRPLFILAYNLSNLMRRQSLPEVIQLRYSKSSGTIGLHLGPVNLIHSLNRPTFVARLHSWHT
jgi:hypothetical protein